MASKEEIATSKSFIVALKEIYSSKGRTIDDFFKQETLRRDDSPWSERRRIRKIIGLLEKGDILMYKKITTEWQPRDPAITGLTWWDVLKGYPPEGYPSTVNIAPIFHNESVLMHLNGYIFGHSGNFVFEDLQPFDDMGLITRVSPYFGTLQQRVIPINAECGKIRSEIAASDIIFRVVPGPYGQLWIHDASWSKEERAQEGLMLHDIISDPRVKVVYPNKVIGVPDIRSVQPIPEIACHPGDYNDFSYELQAIQETTYFMKEHDQIGKIKPFALEMVKIYDSVINIINEMKRLCGRR